MSNQNPASTTTLKGALIGYGFIAARGHLPAYLEQAKQEGDVEIVAICDISEERREAAREALPQARLYTDAEALLEQEADALDFVDIATPPCDHAKIAEKALQLGLHVLCEKPLTTTLEEARRLLDQAKKSERVLYPCHNYKHAPVVKAIRELIDSDRIGKVQSATLTTFRNTHAKGVPEWKTDWRRTSRISGGGIAMDHGSHSFYLVFDWLQSFPTSVTAKTLTLQNQFDTEDNVYATVGFPNGTAQVHLSWTAGVRKVLYSLQGDRGALLVDDDELQLAMMKTTETAASNMGNVEWEFERHRIASDWMDSSHVSWFRSLFAGFRAAIERKEYVSHETEVAFRCVGLIQAVYASAREGSREIQC